MIEFSQKGISLFLAVIMLSVILAIVLGLTTVLIGQLKNISGFGNSVAAYYAAESRAEELLVPIVGGTVPTQYEYGSELYTDGSCSTAFVVCCHDSDLQCDFKGAEQCPIKDNNGAIMKDASCKATKYCLRAYGTFPTVNCAPAVNNVKRAIETKVFPQQ